MKHINWSLGAFNSYFWRRGFQCYFVLVNIPLLWQDAWDNLLKEGKIYSILSEVSVYGRVDCCFELLATQSRRTGVHDTREGLITGIKTGSQDRHQGGMESQYTLLQHNSFDLTSSHEVSHLKGYSTIGDEKSKVKEGIMLIYFN